MTLETEEVVFRSAHGIDLMSYLVRPTAAKIAPAILFLHGGSWRSGHPFSFLPHCHYFASRGMVAASAQYRLLGSTANTLQDCIADAQEAVRWLRGLDGVDATRVVAAGFSAGGHLAACTALLPAVVQGKTSCRPDALVLLNPVTQVVEAPKYDVVAEVSPVAHIQSGAPETLIAYGSRDYLKPLISKFGDAMRAIGNRCDMVEMDGAHTVVHAPIRKREAYVAAVRPIDDFLVSLGFIDRGIDVADIAGQLDPDEILGGRSEMSDPRKSRPRKR